MNPDSLPVAVRRMGDGQVEVRTEDEVRILHDLTGWALAEGHPLHGLAVLRVLVGGRLSRVDVQW